MAGHVVSTYLKHVGYDVLTAFNGLEGIEVFRSCSDLIDLVVSDLQMPVMTGNEAVHQIRKTRPDAKVICITASSEDVRLNGVPILARPFSLTNIDIPVVAVGWTFTGLTPEELEGRLTSVYERLVTATVDNIQVTPTLTERKD